MQILFKNMQIAENLPKAFFDLCQKSPGDPAFFIASLVEETRSWSPVSRKEAAAHVRKIASFLAQLGCSQGSKIGIISNTRIEWSLCDMAILSLGGVTVSVYPSLTKDDVGFILFDSDVEVIFAENSEQVEKLLALHGKTLNVPAVENSASKTVTLNLKKIITFEETPLNPIITSIDKILDLIESHILPPAIPLMTHDSIASIVYTSGTTGVPKGVVQTHGNHLANVWQSTESGVFGFGDTLFLYLPLAHSFARLIHYLALLTPTSVAFPLITDTKSSKIDLNSITTDLRLAPYEYLPSVPRLFEKIKSGLLTFAKTEGFSAALTRITLENAAKIQQFESPLVIDRLLWILLRPMRIIFKRKLFGKKFKHAISGGAKLPKDVNLFFASLEIKILEGYGLTETCVATNVNPVNQNKIGSVGPVFKEIEVKIAKDGEILFRGPNITKSYLNRPTATKEAWDSEGWFLTGDIGYLDRDGYLFITDRKKDLIVTAGGKKIPPQALEAELKKIMHVSQAVVCGDEKPFCVALITLSSPIPYQQIWQAVEAMNQSLPSYEQIKKIKIIDEDFTIENGLLTPTLKPKRKAIIQKYKDAIEELYKK
jgi:long-chain acyl-CoA synthetase